MLSELSSVLTEHNVSPEWFLQAIASEIKTSMDVCHHSEFEDFVELLHCPDAQEMLAFLLGIPDRELPTFLIELASDDKEITPPESFLTKVTELEDEGFSENELLEGLNEL